MVRCQPFPEAYTDPPHALHPANTGRQLRAQKTGVGGLVRHAANSGQPKIDRRRRVSALFEVDPVMEHNGAIEREPGLRAVPRHELPDGVVVRALTAL